MLSSGFTINPIKVKSNDTIIHKYLPSHPALLAIVAPRKSGKTTLLVNMLTRKDMFKGFFHIIHIWSPTIHLDTKWEQIKRSIPEDWVHMSYDEEEFQTIVNDIENLNEGAKSKEKQNVLFVFDDSAAEKGLFTRNIASPTGKAAFTSRHYNISIWMVSQSFKAISPAFRNNIFHWVIFQTPNDREREKIAEELSGHLKIKEFEKVLEQATSKPFSFLYINFESIKKEDVFRQGFGAPIQLTISSENKKRKDCKTDENECGSKSKEAKINVAVSKRSKL